MKSFARELKTKRLGKTELISYLDVDGTRSYGVVYYPVDYEPGKKYPTVFNIYEQFFDDKKPALKLAVGQND